MALLPVDLLIGTTGEPDSFAGPRFPWNLNGLVEIQNF
jgi:hypothetical protein